MPRVVPSHVVAVIERLFPEVISGRPFTLNSDQAEATRALLALVDQIPDELLPSQESEYHALIIGRSTLHGALARWASYLMHTVGSCTLWEVPLVATA
jgi:hypothetical protein